MQGTGDGGWIAGVQAFSHYATKFSDNGDLMIQEMNSPNSLAKHEDNRKHSHVRVLKSIATLF
jgi:ribonuclease BN (tRNA processing enzyme)